LFRRTSSSSHALRPGGGALVARVWPIRRTRSVCRGVSSRFIPGMAGAVIGMGLFYECAARRTATSAGGKPLRVRGTGDQRHRRTWRIRALLRFDAADKSFARPARRGGEMLRGISISDPSIDAAAWASENLSSMAITRETTSVNFTGSDRILWSSPGIMGNRFDSEHAFALV